jgi:hypothetical protein
VKAGLAVIALCLTATAAYADHDEAIGADPSRPVQPADGTVLVARGSTWQVATASGPAPTRQLAAVALGGLDVAAGRQPAGVAIHGADELGAPPPAWPLANRDDARRQKAPIELEPAEAERVALLWATRRFTLGDDDHDLRVLDVHARYGDGIVIWLNGVEIARRRIARDARPMEMASLIRGPEWETWHVPVAPGMLRPGDNVVAVEVRPSGRSSAPRLDVELVGRPAAALVRGPYLQDVGGDAATIVVETDLPSEVAVEWGPSDALGTRVESAAGAALRHEVRITGLPASAPVHYRVIAAGAATPIRSFRTLPARGEVVRVAVYGDVRGGHRRHAELVARIREEDPDLVLGTGDLVMRGSDEGDWQRFFAVAGELLASVPFWSAPGNHDMGRAGDRRRRFADVFVLPDAAERPDWASWYAFDAGDLHITMLDSNAYAEPAQLAWLDADLKSARARGARVLLTLTHDGPFSRGTHMGNQDAVARYVPVLVAYGTTLLVSGHDHIYQRGEQGGLPYVVSGGGGAPLYPIRCGVPGKDACKYDDGMQHVAKEHHYVMLTIYPDSVEMCPKRPDGTALEPCTRYTVR